MPDLEFIDNECLLMDQTSENNKQLKTEEQFQTAFLINVSSWLQYTIFFDCCYCCGGVWYFYHDKQALNLEL